jgi:hypothetical protein
MLPERRLLWPGDVLFRCEAAMLRRMLLSKRLHVLR